MTSATRAPLDAARAERRRRVGTAVLDVFRDPLRTFVLLAVVVGGYLVFAVPYFGGIDEPAHFYRTYQITTGQFVPEKVEGSDFSGACVPADLVDDVACYQRANKETFLDTPEILRLCSPSLTYNLMTDCLPGVTPGAAPIASWLTMRPSFREILWP